jgi:desulfoferrodoxin-like iron-binding protein
MPISGEVYKCSVCDSVVKILNGSDAPPICCDSEMELVTDDAELRMIPDDKNICGTILKCQKCNFKVIMIKDEGTTIQHHMEELMMTADRTTGEWDMIYKCDSCGQIIKITQEGCGPLHCCDQEICVMDIAQVKEEKDKIEIELQKVHDGPYDDPYFICTECEREVKVLKDGEGNVICHGKLMEKRDRIRYYFQGGGITI